MTHCGGFGWEKKVCHSWISDQYKNFGWFCDIRTKIGLKELYGIAFRRGRVECCRRRLWQCHSTDPGFALKTVNPATVFAQGAIFQIIIFHLKDDENPQLIIMDSSFTN